MNERQSQILLVEDEINVGSTLVDLLGQEQYQVTWVQSCADALAEIRKGQFDLVLLDVMLPDGNGFDVASQLRENATFHQPPAIVFLTALGSTDHRVHGLELGAEDYVVKPFHIKELRIRIKNVLKSRSLLHAGEPKLRIGKAEISFHRFQVVSEGKTHSLTQKECTLLRLLANQVDQVVSRDSILDQVWSKDEYPSPRTIDNFIVRLRKLIEEEPHQPKHIRSIRGVGYQLTL